MNCLTTPENGCFNGDPMNFRDNLKKWSYAIALIWFICLLAHGNEMYRFGHLGGGAISSITIEMICSIVFILVCYGVANNINLSQSMNSNDIHLLSYSTKRLYILYTVFISIYMVTNLIQFFTVFAILQPIELVLASLLYILWLLGSILYVKYLWSYSVHLKNGTLE